MSATIDELTVADEPAAWEGLGFAVAGDICVVGDVRIHLAGPHAGERLAGWSLRDAETTGSTACRRRAPSARRPTPRPRTPTASPRSTTWSR